MYYHTLHRGRKYFSCYYIQALSTEEILGVIPMIAVNLMVTKTLGCLKKVNMLDSKFMKVK